MNLESTTSRRRAARAAQPGWPRQIAGWRRLLAECGRKPTRKRVHLLRVSTLRLQAQVEFWLDRNASQHPSAHLAKRWNKLAKHLRKVLGTVRAFDVHLARIAELRAQLTTSSGYEPRSSRVTLRQVEDLQRHCKRQRKRAAKDLMAALAVRRDSHFERGRSDGRRSESAQPALLGDPRWST